MSLHVESYTQLVRHQCDMKIVTIRGLQSSKQIHVCWITNANPGTYEMDVEVRPLSRRKCGHFCVPPREGARCPCSAAFAWCLMAKAGLLLINRNIFENYCVTCNHNHNNPWLKHFCANLVATNQSDEKKGRKSEEEIWVPSAAPSRSATGFNVEFKLKKCI